MSKRILVNLLSFSEEKYYGVGVYFRDIVVDALTRLVKENDCKLLILYLENINVKEMFGIIEHDRIDYVAVSGINSKLKRIFFEQIILPLRFKKFDLVYSPNNINPIFSKGLGRSIITIHDLLPFKKCNRFGWFQKKYLKIFTSLSAKTSHKIVTVSNYSLNEIVDYLHVDNIADYGVGKIIAWLKETFPNGCDYTMKKYLENYPTWKGENRYLLKPIMFDKYKVMFDTTYGNHDYPVRIYAYK